MKSAVVFGKKDIRIVEEPDPIPNDEEVVVKVAFVGICGTDKAVYDGTIGYLKTGLMKYPIRLGHEWSGTVFRIGKNVSDFKVGDRICGDNVVTCGKCNNCRKGNYAFCNELHAVGSVYTWPGAYTEYMCMPERHLYHLPDNVSLENGALIEPAATGLYTAINGRIEPGSVTVVHGTGAIGLIAAQCAKYLGAGTVIVTGRKSEKLAVAKKLGADYVLNWTEQDVTKEILILTGGAGAGSIIESTGSSEVFNSCIEQVKPSGTISVIGSYDTLINGFNADMMVFKNVIIVGLNGCPNMYKPMLDIIATGRITLDSLITDVLPFEKVSEALEYMSSKVSRIKILLKV